MGRSPKPSLGTQHAVVPLQSASTLVMQYGEQTRCAGHLCAIAGLKSFWDHGDLVGWLPWLECCDQGVRALQDKVRLGRCSREVAIYVREQLECMKLLPGMGEEPSESLWIRIKERTRQSDFMVDVCYMPSDQEELVGQAFCRPVGAASCSQALLIMGNFKHPIICWRDNIAEHKPSRRFLESMNDNFLLQMIEEPRRKVLCWFYSPTLLMDFRSHWGCEGQRQLWLQGGRLTTVNLWRADSPPKGSAWKSPVH